MTAPPQEKYIYGPPEYGLSLGCQDCGCRAIFTSAGPHRSLPVLVRCCQCGRERKDLKAISARAGEEMRQFWFPIRLAPQITEIRGYGVTALLNGGAGTRETLVKQMQGNRSGVQ